MCLKSYFELLAHVRCVWLTDVGCKAEEEILPTAVELCLPWRRNTGREPVSSVETHMVPDGSNPVRADGGNWMKGLTHSLSDSQSDSRSQSEHGIDDQLDIKVDRENTDEMTPLCLPSCNAVGAGCEKQHAELKVAGGPAVVGLPPRRKTSRHSETPAQLVNTQSVARSIVCRRPMRCGSFPSSMDAACRAADQGAETEAAASASPLPWRYSGNERAIPDRQAPRRSVGMHMAVMHKDSPAESLDVISTYPQVSCQSFRLSEAESRHSEPVHVPHVIDVVQTGHRVLSATSDSDNDESSDILGNLEQLDSHERICMWLDTLSETNDKVPSELDTVDSNEVS